MKTDKRILEFTERQQLLIEWNIDNRFDHALENGMDLKTSWSYALAFDFNHYIKNLLTMIDVNRVQDLEIADLIDQEYNQQNNL